MAAPVPPMIAANSARRALKILGDRWTLLILRDAFLGTRQFSAWQGRLGVTPTVLTKRLKTLVDTGIFKRARFNEVPPRVEYQLTDKGLDIYPVALMILRWEQTWFPVPAGTRMVLRHTRCGREMQPRFTCGHCSGEVTARDVRYRDGPGAGLESATANRLRRATITAQDQRGTHGFLEHAVDILGDRWSWEAIGAAFLGHKRFDAFQAQTGMASNILSDRLRRLIDDGILTRRAYQDRPPRYEYLLTEKGRDFYAATVMLVCWGDRWLAGTKGPPVLLTHKACGSALDPQVTCSGCGEVLDPHDVAYDMNDGTTARPLTLNAAT